MQIFVDTIAKLSHNFLLYGVTNFILEEYKKEKTRIIKVVSLKMKLYEVN
jgi:hypothetical protein